MGKGNGKGEDDKELSCYEVILRKKRCLVRWCLDSWPITPDAIL
jgi:hypothetical protein